MGYAFISYKSEERHIADSIIELLHQNGIDTWIAPDNIPFGSRYPKVINNAIEESSCHILLLSKLSQESIWVLRETCLASNNKKMIFPILINDFNETRINADFKPFTCLSQYFHLKEIDENNKDTKKLLNSIKNYTGVSEEYKKPALQSDNIDITNAPAPPTAEQQQNKKSENSPENTIPPTNQASNTPASDFVIKNGVLIKYNGSSSIVTIPDGVTEIGEEAFSKCITVTSISIPDSVTSIGDAAFDWCTNLTSITIPNSVTIIGDSAFRWCMNLRSITIPNSVTIIGDSAFSRCSNLTSITIPDSVSSIGDSAFYKCINLGAITIPNSVTSIGDSAFSGCSNLRSITISDSVTSIGDFAFYECTNLGSITIPDSVTSIGIYAFSDCTNLTSITIPNSVKVIDKTAFDSAPEVIITCEKGSYAYKYATEHKLKNSVDMESYRHTGVCQHCGGKFTGLLHKKCSVCGKVKDY